MQLYSIVGVSAAHKWGSLIELDSVHRKYLVPSRTGCARRRRCHGQLFHAGRAVCGRGAPGNGCTPDRPGVCTLQPRRDCAGVPASRDGADGVGRRGGRGGPVGAQRGSSAAETTPARVLSPWMRARCVKQQTKVTHEEAVSAARSLRRLTCATGLSRCECLVSGTRRTRRPGTRRSSKSMLRQPGLSCGYMRTRCTQARCLRASRPFLVCTLETNVFPDAAIARDFFSRVFFRRFRFPKIHRAHRTGIPALVRDRAEVYGDLLALLRRLALARKWCTPWSRARRGGGAGRARGDLAGVSLPS